MAEGTSGAAEHAHFRECVCEAALTSIARFGLISVGFEECEAPGEIALYGGRYRTAAQLAPFPGLFGCYLATWGVRVDQVGVKLLPRAVVLIAVVESRCFHNP
jgi:hypothetical protein